MLWKPSQMLTEIEPELLRDVTGGSLRIRAVNQSTMIASLIQQLSAAIEAMKANSLERILPMLMAMKKGDTQGMLAAMTSGAQRADAAGAPAAAAAAAGKGAGGAAAEA